MVTGSLSYAVAQTMCTTFSMLYLWFMSANAQEFDSLKIHITLFLLHKSKTCDSYVIYSSSVLTIWFVARKQYYIKITDVITVEGC